jgi:hypothetical protein
MVPGTAPTPEVAAYLGAKEETARAQHVIWFRVAVALAVALLISIGSNIYSAAIVHEIRSTQNSNTPITACLDKAVNGLLKDVPLVFSGDKDIHDYTRVASHCPVAKVVK